MLLLYHVENHSTFTFQIRPRLQLLYENLHPRDTQNWIHDEHSLQYMEIVNIIGKLFHKSSTPTSLSSCLSP